ncbi:hypothetical protein Tco_1033118 [Tanacetum coccineum]|uniref:Uncharacterized protein n=1 Tax=Tanacetum coccineum TaxID=301880 RepID=A0ABQ5GDR5_9ASTR
MSNGMVIGWLEQYLRAMVANVLANGVPLAIIPYPPGSLKVAAVDDGAYPAYNLKDKVIFEGEGNDTPGAVGPRRTKRASNALVWHKDFVLG